MNVHKSLKNSTYWLIGITGTCFGFTLLMPPIYARFCEATGFAGGGVKQKDYREVFDASKFLHTEKLYRRFKVQFHAFVEPELPWSFIPLQEEIEVGVGETVLCFFKAKNNSSSPQQGLATYVVNPDAAVPFFNKIQCFCFDEQILNPQEEVDMPVFFYLDSDICNVRSLDNQDEIILSYTFFLSEDQSLAEDIEKKLKEKDSQQTQSKQ